jgi:adenine-specific DNA-methyltransferase
MSHVTPRLIANETDASIISSLHGVRLKEDAPDMARNALPLLALNSLTMLGAELNGRSYGGGILKMEPREAARLPVPVPDVLDDAWKLLQPRSAALDELLREGRWSEVVAEVDRALLGTVVGLASSEIEGLSEDAAKFRHRRIKSKD